jgi:hypothetical protein
VESGVEIAAARAECRDGTVEAFVTRTNRQGTHLIRKATIPFANDATSRLLTPWLVRTDAQEDHAKEVAKRLREVVERFAQAAVSPKRWRGVVEDFQEDVADVPWEVLPQKTILEIWAPQDEVFVDIFTKLGWSKGGGISPRTADIQIHAFLQRSQKFPFADLRPDSNVELGAALSSASLPVAEALPRSMEAYLPGLTPLRRKLDGTTLSADDKKALAAENREIISSCQAALSVRDAKQGAIRRCTFVDGQCPEETVNESIGALEEARKSWEHARGRAVMSGREKECPRW